MTARLAGSDYFITEGNNMAKRLEDYIKAACDVVRDPKTLPSTEDDVLSSVDGLDNDPELRKDVKKALERELMPHHSLASWVGKTIFPLAGKKALEKWAIDRPDVSPIPHRLANTLKGHLYAPMDKIITASQAQRLDSPRRLADETIEDLERLRDKFGGSEQDARLVYSAIKALIADRRDCAIQAQERAKTVDVSAQLVDQVTKRLAHQPADMAAASDDNDIDLAAERRRAH